MKEEKINSSNMKSFLGEAQRKLEIIKNMIGTRWISLRGLLCSMVPVVHNTILYLNFAKRVGLKWFYQKNSI